MSISIEQHGDWEPTRAYLERMRRLQLQSALERYGQMGVAALSAATPVESGLTAASWSYEATSRSGYHSIKWFNSNVNAGVPIAIILQYGHGTGTGGFVQGRDYIMPAIRPVFDQIEAEVRREVTK